MPWPAKRIWDRLKAEHEVARIAFPDAPGPGAKSMISWMRPDAPKIADAAQKLMRL
jgi:hypothetical protein